MINNNELKNITSYVIKGKNDDDFIYEKMGNQCVYYENCVQNFLCSLSKEYTGGAVLYISLSNNGFYRTLWTNEYYEVINEINQQSHVISSDALAICANIFALSLLAEESESLAPKLINYREKLLDYAKQHEESFTIFKIID